MNNTCLHCKQNAISDWSQFKENKLRHVLLPAILSEAFGWVPTLFAESRCCDQVKDIRSKDLHKCQSCGKFYLKCKECGMMMTLNGMPVETETKVQCNNCGKITLYALDDYNSGGG